MVRTLAYLQSCNITQDNIKTYFFYKSRLLDMLALVNLADRFLLNSMIKFKAVSVAKMFRDLIFAIGSLNSLFTVCAFYG